MRGSSWSRLLAILLVVSALPLAQSQSDRSSALESTRAEIPQSELIAPFPSQIVQPTIPEQPIFFPRPLPPPRSPIGLPTLARAAGVIFSGTVTAVIRHRTTRSEAIETVAITFHVEQAVRGATPGENLTVSQWMGLWSGGQRYRVGEHLMVFLYPPSKLGLTSLVGGGFGRFVVDPYGRVLLSAQHMNAFRQDVVLGGKSRVRISDFALAVNRVSAEGSLP